jgi:hypothetical protein
VREGARKRSPRFALPSPIQKSWTGTGPTCNAAKVPASAGCGTSAISGKGHGRFQVGDTYLDIPGRPRRRRTFVVIAHRFGFALAYGIDALLDTPLVGHRCDVPLCQLPNHWRTSNHRDNGRDYASRRGIVRGPLSDTRGFADVPAPYVTRPGPEVTSSGRRQRACFRFIVTSWTCSIGRYSAGSTRSGRHRFPMQCNWT